MQYSRAEDITAFNLAHSNWASANPLDRGDEPQPPVVYDSEEIVDAPASVGTKFGTVIALPGTFKLSSTVDPYDVFVVHPTDLANQNLWVAQ